MLLDIRERVRGWLAYLIVILISIPFVLWGVGEYFSGGKGKPAAEVNGKPITQRALEQAISQQRSRIIQSMGGKASAEFLQSLDLRHRVLDRMINQQVLNDFVHQAGFQAPNSLVADVIRSIDAFQTNGQFDKKKYEQLLQQQGMTVADFESRVRQDVIMRTLDNAISASSIVVGPEVDQFVRLRDQQRQVGMIRISRDQVAPSVDAPTDAQIKQYFEAHKDQFKQPERVKLKYLELSPKTLAPMVKVSDDEIQQAYKRYEDSQKKQVKRWVRHILIAVPKDASAKQVQAAKQKLEKIRQQIVDGKKTFAEEAKEVSDDPGSKKKGGDLGAVAPGEMVKPFEQAMDKLKVGEISQPVRTQYGWHLIKVYKEDHPQIKPLDQMRNQLAQKVRAQGIERIYYKQVEKLSNLAYEQPDSLVPSAEAMGLKVQTSGWISRDDGQGIGSSAKVRKAAFSTDVLKKKLNSSVVELGHNTAVVVRVAQHETAQPLPLDKVHDRIAKTLHQQAIDKALAARADKIIAALKNGEAAQALADKGGDKLSAPAWIKRGAKDDSLDPAVVKAAFALPRPAGKQPVAKSLSLHNGDEAVVYVTAIRDGDPSQLTAKDKQQIRSQIERDYAARTVQALQKALRARAKVKINEDNIKQAKP